MGGAPVKVLAGVGLMGFVVAAILSLGYVCSVLGRRSRVLALLAALTAGTWLAVGVHAAVLLIAADG